MEEWKRSSEREVRGERALAALPPSDHFHHLSDLLESLITSAGGPQAWDILVESNTLTT